MLLELKCVDNSALGRQSVAIGKPPKIIQVYSDKHKKRRHGEMGKLILSYILHSIIPKIIKSLMRLYKMIDTPVPIKSLEDNLIIDGIL